MASKDNNKHKYATNGTEEEAEEVPPQKQKMISDDNSDGDDSSSSTDNYLLKPEEEVSLEEEEMNLSASFEVELLIRRGHSNDGDTSDLEKNGSIGNGRETSDDGDTSNDEEEQLSDDESTFN
jgi:hypothetical protein